ncbi:MAG: hypothetical protein ACYSUK_06815, partial [Planctomycetota bacterium]
MNRRIFVSAIIFFVLCSLGFAKQQDKEKKLHYKKGQVIVRFKDGELESQVRSILGGPLSRRAVRNILSDKVIKNSKVDKEYDKL